MRVRELMTPIEHPITPETPLLEAVAKMAEIGVPLLPVVENGKLVGLLTERALVFGAVQEDSDGDALPAPEGLVSRIMQPPFIADENEELHEVLARIAGKGIRHLGVLDANGQVVGVLALRPAWLSEAPEDAHAP